MIYRASLVICCVAFLACGAHATPISYISATTVPSDFTPDCGDFGLGIFVMSGVRPIVLHYPDAQVVIEDVSFFLSAHLKTDTSAGGHLEGYFQHGEVRLLDDQGGELLVGNVDELVMSEFFNDLGILTAAGRLTVLSGSLGPTFGHAADVFDIVFEIQPRALGHLGQGFAGCSDVSFLPVMPEPSTLAMLGIALGSLIVGYRRRKR